MFFNVNLFSQSLSFKGKIWLDGVYYEPSSKGKTNLNYVPELIFSTKINKNSYLDFKWSYRIRKDLHNNLDHYKSPRHRYRFWMRYIDNVIDFRLGLQKIAFGPGYILRPLSWFDSIDFTDITGFTEGVEAVRFIYTFSNELSIWTWSISSNSNLPSYGGRVELSNQLGNWGITYHRDLNKDIYNQINFYLPEELPLHLDELSIDYFGFRENYRFGFDYRYDGLIGFWTENSFWFIDKYDDVGIKEIYLSMFGFDYTIPVIDGIYLMSETMHTYVLAIDNSYFDMTNTVVNLDVPIDFLNKFSLVSAINWNDEDIYHLLRFITIYDDFSIDFNTQITDGKWDRSFRISFVYNY
ncbi:MAG: hypothetical protein CMG64_02735 [Candidatus Marinimicrobia bacterium]|nr:hypothetical protein [Candidatus Neomarinimicrobiota bacterium]